MTQQAEMTLAGWNVSRETVAALEEFEALVRRWNPTVNLVSKASLPELRERHVLDSAQLFRHCPPAAKHWVDLGSGGGFPGLVIAILAREHRPGLRLTLVESDSRKAAFLRQAAQRVELPVTVLNDRIELLPGLQADVVSARALAPLTELLGLAARHLNADGTAILPKGVRYAEELEQARALWDFDLDRHASSLEPGAAILTIRNIRRANQT
jgi:16S rRNA (guanine527-N7)-methyltransferase